MRCYPLEAGAEDDPHRIADRRRRVRNPASTQLAHIPPRAEAFPSLTQPSPQPLSPLLIDLDREMQRRVPIKHLPVLHVDVASLGAEKVLENVYRRLGDAADGQGR